MPPQTGCYRAGPRYPACKEAVACKALQAHDYGLSQADLRSVLDEFWLVRVLWRFCHISCSCFYAHAWLARHWRDAERLVDVFREHLLSAAHCRQVSARHPYGRPCSTLLISAAHCHKPATLEGKGQARAVTMPATATPLCSHPARRGSILWLLCSNVCRCTLSQSAGAGRSQHCGPAATARCSSGRRGCQRRHSCATE